MFGLYHSMFIKFENVLTDAPIEEQDMERLRAKDEFLDAGIVRICISSRCPVPARAGILCLDPQFFNQYLYFTEEETRLGLAQSAPVCDFESQDLERVIIPFNHGETLNYARLWGHWVMISLDYTSSRWCVYDSLAPPGESVDTASAIFRTILQVLRKLFRVWHRGNMGPWRYDMEIYQRQMDGYNCVIYAIENAVTLLKGDTPFYSDWDDAAGWREAYPRWIQSDVLDHRLDFYADVERWEARRAQDAEREVQAQAEAQEPQAETETQPETPRVQTESHLDPEDPTEVECP